MPWGQLDEKKELKDISKVYNYDLDILEILKIISFCCISIFSRLQCDSCEYPIVPLIILCDLQQNETVHKATLEWISTSHTAHVRIDIHRAGLWYLNESSLGRAFRKNK